MSNAHLKRKKKKTKHTVCVCVCMRVGLHLRMSAWADKCPHKDKDIIESAGIFSVCRPLLWLMHHVQLFNKSGDS